MAAGGAPGRGSVAGGIGVAGAETGEGGGFGAESLPRLEREVGVVPVAMPGVAVPLENEAGGRDVAVLVPVGHVQLLKGLLDPELVLRQDPVAAHLLQLVLRRLKQKDIHTSVR